MCVFCILFTSHLLLLVLLACLTGYFHIPYCKICVVLQFKKRSKEATYAAVVFEEGGATTIISRSAILEADAQEGCIVTVKDKNGSYKARLCKLFGRKTEAAVYRTELEDGLLTVDNSGPTMTTAIVPLRNDPDNTIGQNSRPTMTTAVVPPRNDPAIETEIGKNSRPTMTTIVVPPRNDPAIETVIGKNNDLSASGMEMDVQSFIEHHPIDIENIPSDSRVDVLPRHSTPKRHQLPGNLNNSGQPANPDVRDVPLNEAPDHAAPVPFQLVQTTD